VNDRTSQEEKNSSTGRMFTMITKENIEKIIPGAFEKMSREEFERQKFLDNDDHDFGEITRRIAARLPDVSEELNRYMVD
jgi:isocitrate dehydrogenase